MKKQNKINKFQQCDHKWVLDREVKSQKIYPTSYTTNSLMNVIKCIYICEKCKEFKIIEV